MRCVVCYHNAACWHGLCTECAGVVYAHHPANTANILAALNHDPLGLHQMAVSISGAETGV
jgi:hypothetical protein